MYRQNGTQIAPCIVSWAKYALEIKDVEPRNIKKCSLNYWTECIDIILAQPRYMQYIANRNLAIESYHYVSN